eukprot:scaffold7029_cov66-Phaeocystis_antarctica.AAC.6
MRHVAPLYAAAILIEEPRNRSLVALIGVGVAEHATGSCAARCNQSPGLILAQTFAQRFGLVCPLIRILDDAWEQPHVIAQRATQSGFEEPIQLRRLEPEAKVEAQRVELRGLDGLPHRVALLCDVGRTPTSRARGTTHSRLEAPLARPTHLAGGSPEFV